MAVCDKRDLYYHWGDVGMYIYGSVSLHSPSLKREREREIAQLAATVTNAFATSTISAWMVC